MHDPAIEQLRKLLREFAAFQVALSQRGIRTQQVMQAAQRLQVAREALILENALRSPLFGRPIDDDLEFAGVSALPDAVARGSANQADPTPRV